MKQPKPKLTATEKTKLTWLTARMAKRGLADDRTYGGQVDQDDLQRKFDRILDGARRRAEREQNRK